MSAIILPVILLMITVLLISLTLIIYYYRIRKAVNRKPVSGKRTPTAKLDNDVVFNIRYNDTNQQISCSQFTSFPLPTILENQVSDGTNDQDYTAMHSSCNHIYEDATKI
ncbi:PREDICTED: uncharacterized protein LOC109593246 [Amphimedon queenslandica]|nr:PREDICTED: uncharacterized protein LOC109593246 [Amphimedon queenslandica]|eukprot:XP_019863979.1 PREDICTED: uncharacterized protein LOC109593246 [Amphimedon queenslandica]